MATPRKLSDIIYDSYIYIKTYALTKFIKYGLCILSLLWCVRPDNLLKIN